MRQQWHNVVIKEITKKLHLQERPELETEVRSSEASRSVCVLFGYADF